MFVIIGIVILIVSFALALFSLVREGKNPQEAVVKEPQADLPDLSSEKVATSEVQTEVPEPVAPPPVDQKEVLMSKIAKEIEAEKAKKEATPPPVEPLPQNDDFWAEMMQDEATGEKTEGQTDTREPFVWEKDEPTADPQAKLGGVINVGELAKKQKD